MTAFGDGSKLIFRLALFGVCCQWFAGTAFADDQPAQPKVELTAIRGQVGGLFPYVPHRWSMIAIHVTNPHDAPREFVSATYFDGQPTLQYARRMWLPPRSRLHTFVPVLPPDAPTDGTSRYPFHSLVFDAAKSREVLVKEDSGLMLHSGFLPLTKELPVTAFLDDPGERPEGHVNAAYDLVVACRRSQQYSRGMTQLVEHLYAPDEFSLQPFDHIVVASSRVLGDPTGLASIRRWLYGGGRLWVMLDRVDPRALEAILGDELTCSVVDRIGLTQVRIDPSPKNRGHGADDVEYEEPIDLVRVVVGNDVEVEYTVNGWPAAFTRPFGRGRVMVTTLGPRGWMRPTTPEDAVRQRAAFPGATGQRTDYLQDSAFTTLPPMLNLSSVMMHAAPRAKDFEQTLASHAAEYIGYSIPPRRQIGGLLAAFGGLVLAAGIWLWRRQSLEHLGWIGPALGVVATSALLVVGGRNRHQTEPSVAAVQMMEALPGVDDVKIGGGLAFYSPEAAPWTIQTGDGGRLTPDMAGLEGTTRRMVWNDVDAWEWEHLQLATPQRTAEFQQSAIAPARLEARGTFGPAGLTGRFSAGRISHLTETVLATRFGRVGVDAHSDGTFVAGADRVFSSDQYVEAGFLRDEQDRRRRAFPPALDALLGEGSSDVPLLLGWTDEPRAGFEFDQGRRRLGATLVSIPVALERPAPGTEMQIASPFLPFRVINQPDGLPSSPVWSSRRHEWQERTEFSTIWLKFQVPRALLPAEVTGGRLTVVVSGPVKQLNLLGWRPAGTALPAPGGGETVVLERWNDPVGSRTFEISDRSLLQLLEGGVCVLGLTAGDPEPRPLDSPDDDFSKPSPWRIVQLGLDLSARIPRLEDERQTANRER